MLKIKCAHLWKRWVDDSVNDIYISSIQERISQHSKEDWKNMGQEALEMMNLFNALNQNQISPSSEEARQAYVLLIEHFDKWFSPLNEYVITKMAFLATGNQEYKDYFDQFGDNLSEYFSKVLFCNLKISKL